MESTATSEKGFLNTDQLKYIAAAFMVLDSAWFAIDGLLPTWIHLITRFVSPLFAFFVVEGFFHTRSRAKYLARLWIAAALMLCGDFASRLLLGAANQIPDNIFLTLAIGFSLMYILENARKSEEAKQKYGLYVLFALSLSAGLIFSVVPIGTEYFHVVIEGGLVIFPTMLIFYLFYGNRSKQVVIFLIWNAAIILLTSGAAILPSSYPSTGDWFESLCFNSDNLTFLFLPFILLYNGKKAANRHSAGIFSMYSTRCICGYCTLSPHWHRAFNPRPRPALR